MLLEGKNLGFRYGNGPWIFRNINISINSGEIVGLMGPSGCGKTTLAKILACYQKPDEGSVTLDDCPLKPKGYNPVQLVFQHPEKAVNTHWKMKPTLMEGWEVSDDILNALGIQRDWFNRWPNELSAGELQRFCVARALGPKTRFLIADEMTTMLDAITQAQIWQVVLDIARKCNLGVLVISHDESLVDRICSRIITF